MARVNGQGYVEVRSRGGRKGQGSKATYKGVWIGRKEICVGRLNLPMKYWGKRVRIKVETEK